MEEAYRVFEYLGIKDVTKPFQKRKGTEVWELPQKTIYNNGHESINRFTIYRNGYIRKMTPWQRVKDRFIAQLVVKQQPSFIAEHYGYQLVYKQPSILSLEDIENTFKIISLKEVNNMCKLLFDFTKMNICILGEYKEKNIVDFLYKRFNKFI